MIKVKGLEKSFNKLNVLNSLNLRVEEGDIYGFIGKNGAGKSTTMNILAGLLKFEKGECSIDGIDISSKRKPSIGYLPEEPRFYDYMTAIEYLNFIGSIQGKSQKERNYKNDLLLQLTSLNDASRRKIGGFSRGMKQRMGLAVSLYNNPKLLLLDEPSSALDPEGRKGVVSIIKTLKNQGKTVFLSTHILSDVERVCTRAGILANGKIVLEDKMDSLLSHHLETILDIEFQNPLADQAKKDILKNEDIKTIKTVDNSAAIYLKKDMDFNKIIEQLIKMNQKIICFSRRKSSLEDIFLKEVYNEQL